MGFIQPTTTENSLHQHLYSDLGFVTAEPAWTSEDPQVLRRVGRITDLESEPDRLKVYASLATKFRCQGPCGKLHEQKDMRTFQDMCRKRGVCPECFGILQDGKAARLGRK